MNPTFFTKILLPLLFFAAIIGFFLNYTDPITVNATKQCDIDLTQQCKLLHDNQQISVRFLQAIEVEEELLLSITVPSNTNINQMWVQGVNMYMGKTAVLADSIDQDDETKTYNARLFLGACSEPKMKWQLIIQTIDLVGKEQSWFVNFSTDRNKKS